MRERLDSLLERAGFHHAEGRELVRMQIAIATGLSLAAVSISELSDWGWAFMGGAALITVNFWWLVKYAQNVMSNAAGAAGGAFFRFFVRLGVTGAGLYAMIVEAGWPVWAIVAGTITVMVTILVWGARKRARSNSAKEA
ncbi:ATP synthase subunit I [Fundidesulfovibrio soli]|uniref:ATP synthase subunit I n=1 Tax=Fundidesulfovibrio soli TaxID=2922716 RepID=UPI001FAEFB01|nr:ATP synthase subunit I [Fundidesulfovibrio soli]